MNYQTNRTEGIKPFATALLYVISLANLSWCFYFGYHFWSEIQGNENPNLTNLFLYLLGMMVGNIIYLIGNHALLGGFDE